MITLPRETPFGSLGLPRGHLTSFPRASREDPGGERRKVSSKKGKNRGKGVGGKGV